MPRAWHRRGRVWWAWLVASDILKDAYGSRESRFGDSGAGAHAPALCRQSKLKGEKVGSLIADLSSERMEEVNQAIAFALGLDLGLVPV